MICISLCVFDALCECYLRFDGSDCYTNYRMNIQSSALLSYTNNNNNNNNNTIHSVGVFAPILVNLYSRQVK